MGREDDLVFLEASFEWLEAFDIVLEAHDRVRGEHVVVQEDDVKCKTAHDGCT